MKELVQGEQARSWLGLSPLLFIFIVVEWLLVNKLESFSQLMSFMGVVTVAVTGRRLSRPLAGGQPQEGRKRAWLRFAVFGPSALVGRDLPGGCGDPIPAWAVYLAGRFPEGGGDPRWGLSWERPR